MSNRGALILAAALTAFVLVVAGGIAGRLSKPAARAVSSNPASAKVVVASRSPEQRAAVRPALRTWRADDDEHEREAISARRDVGAEHEDDDD